MTMRRDLLVLVVLVALAPLLFLGAAPILQPAAYHELADQRSLLGIGHFWNVVSNLPFLVVGLMGLDLLRRRPEEAAAGWAALFCGNVLVAFGSAWYHSNPNDATLIWDRLPIGRRSQISVASFGLLWYQAEPKATSTLPQKSAAQPAAASSGLRRRRSSPIRPTTRNGRFDTTFQKCPMPRSERWSASS